jgi:surface protein
MHDIKSIRMFEDDVTRPEHARVIQGSSLGELGWWHDACSSKNLCSSFRLLFLRVDCECNGLSFLGTVFHSASSFNGDVKQWNVAKVTNMQECKLIRKLENVTVF